MNKTPLQQLISEFKQIKSPNAVLQSTINLVIEMCKDKLTDEKHSIIIAFNDGINCNVSAATGEQYFKQTFEFNKVDQYIKTHIEPIWWADITDSNRSLITQWLNHDIPPNHNVIYDNKLTTYQGESYYKKLTQRRDIVKKTAMALIIHINQFIE